MCQSYEQDIGIKDSDGDSYCSNKTAEGDVLAETCDDLIRSIHFLREIVNTQGDGFVAQRHMDVMVAVADLTKAVVEYLEPADSGEPY